MKITSLLLFYLIVICACKERVIIPKTGGFIIESEQTQSSIINSNFYFDEQNVLTKSTAQSIDSSIEYVIHYYPNGLVRSCQKFRHKVLDGNSNIYFDNGVIRQIQPYSNGVMQGESISYFSNGFIKSLNLIDEDSIYYVRVYVDSNSTSTFREDFIPIIFTEFDTVKIGDSIRIKIRFPLFPELGIIKGKFKLNYDIRTEDALKKIIPIARNVNDILGEDIVIELSSEEPEHDKFYCYITDTTGKILGPIIFRDIYFIQ